MSCGTWNERESKCVLSMRVVGFFEWGRVLLWEFAFCVPSTTWPSGPASSVMFLKLIDM